MFIKFLFFKSSDLIINEETGDSLVMYLGDASCLDGELIYGGCLLLSILHLS
jgi:hypothetical protein